MVKSYSSISLIVFLADFDELGLKFGLYKVVRGGGGGGKPLPKNKPKNKKPILGKEKCGGGLACLFLLL